MGRRFALLPVQARADATEQRQATRACRGMSEHRVHEFTRLISESSTGTALYGCAFRANGTVIGCAETEVRAANQPSPYAVKREAARVAAAKRKHQRGGS